MNHYGVNGPIKRVDYLLDHYDVPRPMHTYKQYEDQRQLDKGNKRTVSGVQFSGHPTNQDIKRKSVRAREQVYKWVVGNLGQQEPVFYRGHAERYDLNAEYRSQMQHAGTPRDLYLKQPRSANPTSKEKQYGPFKRVHCERHLASPGEPAEYDE